MAEINLFRHADNIVEYEPGQIVFQEGDPAAEMYAIIEGTVDILVGDTIIDSPEAGSVFGEMALVDGSPRSATARARTRVRLAPVGERQFLRMIEHTPRFAIQVMRLMALRLRRLMESTPDAQS